MSTMQANRLSAEMSAQDLADVKAAFQKIYTYLPFLIGLTADERRTLPKISEANRLFVEDSLVSVQNNPDFMPPYFNVVEMQKDFNLYRQLDELVDLAAQLSERLRDTQILAGSESYQYALTSYRFFEAAANAGMPGADAVYDKLKLRFASQGGNRTPEGEGESSSRQSEQGARSSEQGSRPS